jgi:hypothetical protein
MNVFVLSTGRCGSTTFARACEHIKNFSAAHESRIGRLHERIEYPEDHIEVDNRLSWFLGRLDRLYGDSAFYVHLKRDPEAVARSFTKRYGRGVILAYRKHILWRAGDNASASSLSVCRHYVDTVNSNIESFLRGKSKTMDFRLKSAKKDFRKFWRRIGAQGDLPSSLSEWTRKYNASDSNEAPLSESASEPTSERSSFPVRVARKVARAVRNFPKFIRKV